MEAKGSRETKQGEYNPGRKGGKRNILGQVNVQQALF
jgi:hypothetical protein